MYSGPSFGGGLNITKIIGGLSKTLQIANQVIPLYQKTKPIISNARNLFSIVKEFGKNTKTEETELKTTSSNQKNRNNKTQEKKEEITSPTFFL